MRMVCDACSRDSNQTRPSAMISSQPGACLRATATAGCGCWQASACAPATRVCMLSWPARHERAHAHCTLLALSCFAAARAHACTLPPAPGLGGGTHAAARCGCELVNALSHERAHFMQRILAPSCSAPTWAAAGGRVVTASHTMCIMYVHCVVPALPSSACVPCTHARARRWPYDVQ